ncbi:hypothetical protein LTR85_002563 [Meristemomyces frigidus]|nr:hypothetical protein LTR85_002563 [Meristemomyces frigidus]
MAYKNIAVFGAGGSNIGHHILQALVADGSFTVTVLARASSKTIYPPSISVTRIEDFNDHGALVKALHGRDVVISAVGPGEGMESQQKLIDAAVDAGVKRFFPSEWGFDNADPKAQELCPPVFGAKSKVKEYLRSRESAEFSWTAVATSIWTDWALGMKFFDIDPVAHTARYWRNGTHAFSQTTLPYAAQAVIQVLKHPDATRNERVFLSAFEASQRDIVAELEKQQGMQYTVDESFDADKVVEEAKAKWLKEGDLSTLATTIRAAVMLPEYGTNFVSAGKKPILEQVEGVRLPTLTLESVVRQWLTAQAAAGK